MIVKLVHIFMASWQVEKNLFRSLSSAESVVYIRADANWEN